MAAARVHVVRRPPSTAELERMAEVDEYGEIARRLALCEPDQARLRVLAAKIQARHERDSEDVMVVERGHDYEIQMSPRRHERTITNKRKAFEVLKKALGFDGLLALLDIPLTNGIDKVIPKSQQKAFVTEERSGYRTLTVVALASVGRQTTAPPPPAPVLPEAS